MRRRFLEFLGYWGTWLGFELGALTVRLFPRGFLFSVSQAMADSGFYLFRNFRKRSIQNLGIALGNQLDTYEIEEIARAVLRNFFRAFVEIGLALQASPEEIRGEIPIEGREHLEAALSQGQGVIALSAHLGNFFLLGTRLAAEGYPISVLVNPTRHGRFAEMMDRYRLKVGQKTIHARPRRQAARELLQALRRNDLVVMIADEYRTKGIPVSFFGGMVLARRGPVTLALRTRAIVLPLYLVRNREGQLTLVIEPELKLQRSGRLAEDLAGNALRITQWLERAVRSYPDQWNWMNVRWHGGQTAEGSRQNAVPPACLPPAA